MGGERKCLEDFGGETSKRSLERVGVKLKVLLKRILKKENGIMWNGFIWLWKDVGIGLCSTLFA